MLTVHACGIKNKNQSTNSKTTKQSKKHERRIFNKDLLNINNTMYHTANN
jgi:hypothetical protein